MTAGRKGKKKKKNYRHTLQQLANFIFFFLISFLISVQQDLDGFNNKLS